MSAELRINADALSDLAIAVDEVGGAAEGADLRLVLGMAMREIIRDHFIAIAQDEAHHKSAIALGAIPTGLYEQIVTEERISQPEITSDGVAVEIRHPAIAQRYYGGPIAPVSAKWLTIPARTETYGHRAREFDNLQFILFPSGSAALVQRDASVLRGGRRGGEKGAGTRSVAGVSSQRKGQEMGALVFYWLVKQVTQPPDPTVLPDDDAVTDAAIARAVSYLTRIWHQRSIGS